MDSAYVKELKAGIARVSELTTNYTNCVRDRQHGMAAICKGELESARAYLHGLTVAHDLLTEEKK